MPSLFGPALYPLFLQQWQPFRPVPQWFQPARNLLFLFLVLFLPRWFPLPRNLLSLPRLPLPRVSLPPYAPMVSRCGSSAKTLFRNHHLHVVNGIYMYEFPLSYILSISVAPWPYLPSVLSLHRSLFLTWIPLRFSNLTLAVHLKTPRYVSSWILTPSYIVYWRNLNYPVSI